MTDRGWKHVGHDDRTGTISYATFHCRVCDSLTAPYDSLMDLDVRFCPSCGQVQLSNPPVMEWQRSTQACGISDEMMTWRTEQLTAWLARTGLDQHQGRFLRRVITYEGNPWVRDILRGHVTTPTTCGFHVVHDTAGKADGFVMCNLLEHHPRPLEALRAVREWLKDGAVGLVEVPWNRPMAPYDYCVEHLTYWTSMYGFADALRKGGFHVNDMYTTWHDHILTAEVSVVPMAAPQKVDVAAIRDKARALIPQGRYAVWGDGHQSRAIREIAGMTPAYVVDSDPAKAYPPSHLLDDPVDAVVVMCAGYTDEVAEKARALAAVVVPIHVEELR